jgi:hypothetical protein
VGPSTRRVNVAARSGQADGSTGEVGRGWQGGRIRDREKDFFFVIFVIFVIFVVTAAAICE